MKASKEKIAWQWRYSAATVHIFWKAKPRSELARAHTHIHTHTDGKVYQLRACGLEGLQPFRLTLFSLGASWARQWRLQCFHVSCCREIVTRDSKFCCGFKDMAFKKDLWGAKREFFPSRALWRLTTFLDLFVTNVSLSWNIHYLYSPAPFPLCLKITATLHVISPWQYFLEAPSEFFFSFYYFTLLPLNPVWEGIWSSIHPKSLQLCPTLCDPMDQSLPGFSVHGILQARILVWVAIPSSRGIFLT